MACNLPRSRMTALDGFMKRWKITNIELAERAGVNPSTINRARHNHNILNTHCAWIAEAAVLISKEKKRDKNKTNRAFCKSQPR